MITCASIKASHSFHVSILCHRAGQQWNTNTEAVEHMFHKWTSTHTGFTKEQSTRVT